jgi:tetratricopeptide (TPR) repeat protein
MNSLRDQLQPLVEQAMRLHQAGQIAQAEQGYRQVLAQDPGNPDALHLLGLIAHDAGHPGPAAELITRAIASDPQVPLYPMNLAKVYRAAGRFDDALASSTRAVELAPMFAPAHIERSACLKALGRMEEAEQVARAVVAIAPDAPEAHGVLANALADQGLIDQAIAEYHIALRLRPQWGEALSNLGESLRKLGRYDEAEKYFRDAIRATPNVAEPHFNLGILLLAHGKFEEGWREYEWRWRQIGVRPRSFQQPAWSGSPLRGQTILLYAEQGLGDAIQFVRYAPMIRDLGLRVIVECEAPLASLIRTVDGAAEVVVKNATLPFFDVQCALASLPLRFQTTLQTIPNRCPYVSFDADRAARWREQLHLSKDVKNIGLVWAGSGVHKNDRNRSCRLSDFAPLAGVANARFVSLQLGPAAAQLNDAPFPIENPTADIHDFADTAALMSQFDLIISVDTSPAHLAGALARPVWTIHPFVPDFRWLLDRDDSPWYPTMRIFRQPSAGDWKSVMEWVAVELAQFSQYSPAHGPG